MKVRVYDNLLSQARIPVLKVSESFEYDVDEKYSYASPERLIRMFKNVFLIEKRAEEFGYMVCLDNKMHLIGMFEISRGSVCATVMSAREVYMKALLCGASNIILVHNHPSGDSEPSKDDIRTTKKIRDAGKLIGVMLVDHIIIGRDEYCSMNEKQIGGFEEL